MIRHPIRNKTLLLLFIASLPALAAKLLLGNQLDYYETHNVLLGACFLFTGLLLLLTQWLARRNKRANSETDKVGVPQALAMGVMQAVGMLPGISRSGSTIFGGVAARLDREAAAKFSFMMSAPAILAGMLSEGKDVLLSGAGLENINLPAVLLGMLVAGVSGYFAIRFMLKLISKVSLGWFALYVIALGILVIVLQSTGMMPDPQPDVIARAARMMMG